MVACKGLVLKTEIDDFRENPAVGITRCIAWLGRKVLCVKPNIDVLQEKLSHLNLVLRPHAAALCLVDVGNVLVKHWPVVKIEEDLAAWVCN